MPIVYKILRTPHVHLVSYQGIVTNAELLASYQTAFKDPLYVPGIPEISDLRFVGGIDIDLNGIQRLVEWVNSRDDLAEVTTKVAILQHDEALTSISKLYAAVSDIYDREATTIFSSLATALDWLAIDPGHAGVIETELGRLAGRDGGVASTGSAAS